MEKSCDNCANLCPIGEGDHICEEKPGVHRQGQTEKVIIHHLVCTETRDEDVMKALSKKDDVQGWVMASLKARIKAIKENQSIDRSGKDKSIK